MKRLRFSGWAILSALVASWFLARVHPFGDAGLYANNSASTAIAQQTSQNSMPENVRALLTMKCADCHSSQPHPPVYGHFAPISWLLERDIVNARKEMNLSDWASYTPEQQDTLRSKIVEETRAGDMPLLQYRMIHRSTAITPADIQTLTAWAHGAVAAGSSAQATMAGDPVRGQAVFEKRCTGCHSLTNNREGPRLQGVYGRPAGWIPGFPYSGELLKAHVVWNEQTLDQWLTEPDDFVPGTNMDFRVPKEQERRDLIAYFKKLSAK